MSGKLEQMHSTDTELPDIDERLVAPETRYEIMDGQVIYVPPADTERGTAHARLAALLDMHRAEGFTVAIDMLTRTSRLDDIAADVSVFPRARDPRTGGRQLEQLAFEIAHTESLDYAGKKAAKLIGRGVRRVFAIDLDRDRVLEWSPTTAAWVVLDRGAQLEDPALLVPLPIVALLDEDHADAAISAALEARLRAEYVAARAEAFAEARAAALLEVLAWRGLEATPAERQRMLAECDLARLDRWVAAVWKCASVADLLARP